MGHPLDNPAFAALSGPQAAFAERSGPALRYRPDVSPFAALPDHPDGDAWEGLAALVGAGETAVLPGLPDVVPPGWEVLARVPGVQMDGSALAVRPDPEAVVLGDADVPEMLDLVARTRPGPLLPATHALGTYLGIRRGGALVAMAGERMRVLGWTEISAVCTDPAHRGQGLAARLVRAVGAVIRERGEVPFLHATATNPAIGLYEQLGFTHRRGLLFAAVRAPATCSAGTGPPPRRTPR